MTDETRNELLRQIRDAYLSGEAATSSGDFSTTSEESMGLTETAVTSFSQNSEPDNVSFSDGKFYLNATGIYQVILERTYRNADQSPAGVVSATINIYRNGELTPIFTNTAPLSAATGPAEPSFINLCTPFLVNNTAGDYYEIKVLGVDGILAPLSLALVKMKVVGNLIKAVL